MLRRFNHHTTHQTFGVVTATAAVLVAPPPLLLFLDTTATTSMTTARSFHYKFQHLDFKYKRLFNVSPRNDSNNNNNNNNTAVNKKNEGEENFDTDENNNSDQNDNNSKNFNNTNYDDDEIELLKNLSRREANELQNRQNATSGFSASSSANKNKSNNNNKNKANRSNDDGDGDTTNESKQQQQQARDEIIMSKEVSDCIGFFPKNQILLLPNTTGRFKQDERKLTIKHSCLVDAKKQIFTSTSGDDFFNKRIMIFGQDTMPLAVKCAKAMNKIASSQSRGNGSAPLLIVVDKNLEKLVQMNQQIQKVFETNHQNTNNNITENNNHCSSSSSSYMIRSTDPYFSLLHCVPDRSLRRLVVSFPPPCSSDNESHRRIVNHHFLSLVHQKLSLGGDIVITTDYLPLHKFHKEQVLITEGKLSWAEPPAAAAAGFDGIATENDGSDDEDSSVFLGDDKKRKTLTQLRAKIEEQQKQQKKKKASNDLFDLESDNYNNTESENTNSIANDDPSKDDDYELLLDTASMPTIEEAPPRIKFSLLQKQQQQHQQPLFYTLRRFKDMETPEHVVLQNAGHVNERRLRYGALKK